MSESQPSESQKRTVELVGGPLDGAVYSLDCAVQSLLIPSKPHPGFGQQWGFIRYRVREGTDYLDYAGLG